MRRSVTTLLLGGLVLALSAGCSLLPESALEEESETTETIDIAVDTESDENPESTATSASSTSTASTSTSTSSTSTSSTSSTSTSSTSTTTTVDETTTSAPPTTADSGDAEADLRYDFGSILAWTGIGTDQVKIEFDRYQLLDGRQGPGLDREVEVSGSSDLGWSNENPRARTYVLSPSVETLAVDPAWLSEVCGGANAGPVRYLSVDLPEFASGNAFVALTFDELGQVTRMRHQTTC